MYLSSCSTVPPTFAMTPLMGCYLGKSPFTKLRFCFKLLSQADNDNVDSENLCWERLTPVLAPRYDSSIISTNSLVLVIFNPILTPPGLALDVRPKVHSSLASLVSGIMSIDLLRQRDRWKAHWAQIR